VVAKCLPPRVLVYSVYTVLTSARRQCFQDLVSGRVWVSSWGSNWFFLLHGTMHNFTTKRQI